MRFRLTNIKKYVLLALVSILIIPAWFYFVAFDVVEISSDFSYAQKVDSFDNFYDPLSKSFLGENQSNTKLSYKVIEKSGGKLMIENSFDVKTLSGKPIFSAERVYGISKKTGRHVAGFGDKDRSGYLFGPRMKGLVAQERDKSSFNYWHVNYDVPIQMEYRDSTLLYGLTVYRYQANFQADQTKELTGVLEGVGIDTGVNLDVRLELLVEPVTGRVIEYADQAEAFYYDLASGERTFSWNKFHNNTRAVSAAELARVVSLQKQRIYLVTYIIPAVILLVILLVWLYPIFNRFFIRNISGIYNQKERSRTVIVSVSATSLMLTLILFSVTNSIAEQTIQTDFEEETRMFSNAIVDRMDLYASLLQGGRGLFDASVYVDRLEWKAYADGLDFQTNYPGIQGVGFIKTVKSHELESFVTGVRSEGFQDFNVNPTGDRDTYAPVTYIEPFDVRNKRAFGFDLMTESIRREALIDARDQDGISITGKVVLLQEDSLNMHPGFLALIPVYKSDVPVIDVATRRENLFGYVYAPFRMKNFMIGVLTKFNTGLGVEIFDGHNTSDLSEDRLMYRNDLVPNEPERELISRLSLFGHSWTIRYTAEKSYGFDLFKKGVPILVLITGLLFTVFISIFVHTVNNRRVKAVMLANEMTEKLLHQEARLASILEGIAEGLFAVDLTGRIIMVNKAFEKLTGFSEDEVVDKFVYSVIPMYNSKKMPISSDERPIYKTISKGSTVETPISAKDMMYMRIKDGSLLPVIVTASPIIVNGERIGAVEVFRDIKS